MSVSWKPVCLVIILFVMSGAFASLVYLLRVTHDTCYVVSSFILADACAVFIECDMLIKEEVNDCSKSYVTGEAVHVCYNAFEFSIGGCSQSPALIAIFVVLSLMMLLAACIYTARLLVGLYQRRRDEQTRSMMQQQQPALAQSQTQAQIPDIPLVTINTLQNNYILGKKDVSKSVYIVIENP